MSRYRKTMAEAYGAVVENSAIQMQIAALKKAYEPMRNKRISLDNANKLSQIFDKFDSNKEMLKQLYKADIPFVSSVATSRLISKHNMKAQQLMQIRKEDVEKLTDEIKQVREAREKDLEDFEIFDEPYYCEFSDGIKILLESRYTDDADAYVSSSWKEDIPRPQMYLHKVGKGSVLYLMLGHCRGKYDMRPFMDECPVDRGGWESEVFYELLRRGIKWGINKL